MNLANVLSNADDFAGIVIAARVSAVNGINALMNAESLMGFELKDPASFLKLVP